MSKVLAAKLECGPMEWIDLASILRTRVQHPKIERLIGITIGDTPGKGTLLSVSSDTLRNRINGLESDMGYRPSFSPSQERANAIHNGDHSAVSGSVWIWRRMACYAMSGVHQQPYISSPKIPVELTLCTGGVRSSGRAVHNKACIHIYMPEWNSAATCAVTCRPSNMLTKSDGVKR